MARSAPINAERFLVRMENAAVLTLPSVETQGTEYVVCDNLGLGKTVVITAPVASGNTTTITGHTGWVLRFVWTGAFYCVEYANAL